VTLITGDRVTLQPDGTSVQPRPGKGRESIRFILRRQGRHAYAIPSDAAPLLASGLLDSRLFDVTALLDFGYSDRQRRELPLIVTSSSAGARAIASGILASPGIRVSRQVSTVDALALRAGKGDMRQLWSAIKTGAADVRAAGNGAGRIWLDGVRQPLLDQSVPQIGAPAAWQAGLTGSGVVVAVLDTGVDATHPDLASRVTERRNFTEDPSPDDTVGHGTHVASIIAGNGATYRGVAPGAMLLDGKVCDANGCLESAILSGMQWAAAEKRAKVVNLSFGSTDESGLDPLEDAVNRLSADYGSLFVAAAGNVDETCFDGTGVSSPASADATTR
jgi:subtilisin family serine protease